MKDKTTTIANRIKLFRKMRGLSQKDLSDKSAINFSLIKKYEANIAFPKIDRLEVIANALGISLYSLVDLNVNNINDVVSILLQMDQQTIMNVRGQKGKDGKYKPESIQISFDDESINTALAEYLEIKESEKENGGDWTLDFNTKVDDIDVLIESSKAQLYLNDEKVKRPK